MELNKHRVTALLLFLLAAAGYLGFIAYERFSRNSASYTERKVDLEAIRERGVLRAITEYNSISYFIYKGQPVGFDLDLMKGLARQLGVRLEVVVARNTEEMYTLLRQGKGDIIANGLPEPDGSDRQMSFTQPYRQIEQVIVQRQPGHYTRPGDSVEIFAPTLKSALDLNRKTIFVGVNSPYYHQLRQIADTLGLELDLRIIGDDRSNEDLIEAVSTAEIDYTLADKDLALVNNSYFNNLDVSVSVGRPRNLHYAVRTSSPELLKAVNEWISKFTLSAEYTEIFNKYFKSEKRIAFGFDEARSSGELGRLSAYDAIIQKYARRIDWDWRLVAALIQQESAFNPLATSWAGARGLMQLMPGTARQMGLMPGQYYQPEPNIRAGTAYLKLLEKSWEHIPDLTQRVKFILASYNAGPGHVQDAARLAEKYGYPADKWDGAVEYFILYKSNPRFYTDAVVRYGYCRGSETFNYVRRIIGHYFRISDKLQDTSGGPLFALEHTGEIPFAGVAGLYNPSTGLIARQARQELFISQKLFEIRTELQPRDPARELFQKSRNPFEQNSLSGLERTSDELFRQRNLFEDSIPVEQYDRLEPRKDYTINTLKKKPK